MSELPRKRLGELGEFIRGKGGTKRDATSDGVPCVRYGDLYTQHDCVIREFSSFIRPSTTANYTRLNRGDVLFASSGETHEEIGKAAAYLDDGEAYGSGDMVILRPNSLVEPAYLGYAVNTHQSANFKAKYGQGSSVIHISSNHLSDLEIFTPPLPEQRRIAEILDTIDEAIRKTEEVIAKLEQMKQGLLHDLLTRGIDENGELRDPERHPEQFEDSQLGRIPREWRTQTVMDIAADTSGSTVIGPFGSNLTARDYRKKGVPVVFVRDVKEEGFQWNSDVYVSRRKAQELSSHHVDPGDVLATKMGLPPAIAAVYPSWMPTGVITADIIRLRPDLTTVSANWVALCLNSPVVRAQVRAITGGVTRPKITLRDFRSLRLAVPSHNEQQRILDSVSGLTGQLSEEEQTMNKLQTLKLGLMDDLLTGRVRVSVKDKEMAR